MSFGLLKQLFHSPTIWILGIINLLLVGPLEGFADAWAEPFLSKGFDILPDHALGLSSLVFIGLISGSPIVPFLGQRFGHRAAILWCALGIVGTFTLLFYMSLGQYISASPHWFIGGLLFFIGMCCSYQTNLLTMGRESVSPQLGGVAVALLNAWNMSGGTIFHTIIGFVLKNRPMATSSSMASVNNVIALSCIPLAALVGVVLLMTMVRPRRSDEKRI
jgi:MFS family permease